MRVRLWTSILVLVLQLRKDERNSRYIKLSRFENCTVLNNKQIYLFFKHIGSYNNSRRNIEPELLRIMNENSYLKYFLSNSNNEFLSASLNIIKPKKSVGSLSALDDFESDDYLNFIRLSRIEDESAIGTEPFPGELMSPCYETNLPKNILDLLVEYYDNLYDDNFISISSVTASSRNFIVVNSKIKQYGRLRIGADIYGSIQAARHEKSSYILARFVQNDGTIDIYPGQVQFFFEHAIYLNNNNSTTHSLALVRWYKLAQDHKIRYYCQVDEEDINSCNIELWSNEFYDMSRDSIIPIHNILGNFIKGKFHVGKKKLKEYMAVVPLNRKLSF